MAYKKQYSSNNVAPKKSTMVTAQHINQPVSIV